MIMRTTRLCDCELESRLAPTMSPVRDINTAITPLGSNPASIVEMNGALYFSANTTATGVELWKSDGTSSGTVLVRDIRPGGASSNPTSLVNVNGTLFFVANNGISGPELWKSDGTS